MRNDLRAICQREIERINNISQDRALERDDIEKLKSLAMALKTLEDSKTPEVDSVAEILSASSMDDLNALLDKLDG